MTPKLSFSFSIEIKVEKPIIINATPDGGKRQLIPISEGKVSGRLTGTVLPGGIDSQIIDKEGMCRLSARYAVQTDQGNVYIENNGLRKVPVEWREQLFNDDMSFFNLIPQHDIYFRTIPKFEIYSDSLQWMIESIFVCSGERTSYGVSLNFYELG